VDCLGNASQFHILKLQLCNLYFPDKLFLIHPEVVRNLLHYVVYRTDVVKL